MALVACQAILLGLTFWSSGPVLRFLRRLFSVNYFSGLRGLFLLAHCVTQLVIRAS